MLNARMTRPQRQQGLSLVEMMVGIAVGLVVVAAATLMVTTQLGDNRRMLLETQLQQDLRATADIVARDLWRAGALRFPEFTVWNTDGATVALNPMAPVTPASGAAAAVDYNYQRGPVTGPYGFELLNGVVRTRLAAGGWQELTDRNVLTGDEFTITADPSAPIRLPCPNACTLPAPAGQPDDYCWPTTTVRNLTVRISGVAISDPALRRTIESQVRVRNDAVRFNQPNPDPALAADPTANVVCPP
jgi:prepilin-type N-terminal cleavage/methylation domain-containing protein